MPFSEPTKLKAKRKAHFCCVVCHQPFVEVHHIIPQADDGTDDLDNAAPLCALCHDHFGGNPDKRKQIREMRDLWYELCETRFRDSPTLELAEAIEDVKGSQQEQAALLSSIKRLLENFYTHQSEKVSKNCAFELSEKGSFCSYYRVRLSDAEGSDFADDLDSALREADWQTSRIRNRTDGAGVRYGVFLGTFDRTKPRDRTNVEAGKRLHDTLTSVGIKNEETIFEAREEATMSPYFKAGELYLIVAHKPPA